MTGQGNSNASYAKYTIPQRKTDRQEASDSDLSTDEERFNTGVTHDTSYSLSDTDLDEKTSDHELYDTIKFEWTEKRGKKWPAKKIV